MKIAGYEVHPAAAALPEIPDAEFAEFKADIKANGQLCPVELYQGKIIDGRNRARACKELGLDIWTSDAGDLSGMTPAAYVVSLNVHRRHLEKSQRAMLAVNLLPEFEAEAKERQRDHGGTAPGKPANTGGTIATSDEDAGKSRDKAAAAAQVSPRLVSDAKAIKAASPKLAEEVAKGEKTIAQAKREIAPPKPSPKKGDSPRNKNGSERITAASRKAAFAALGALVRSLDQMGIVDRCRSMLSSIEKEIQDAV